MDPLKGFSLSLLTVALACCGFITTLDFSIANVSIPYIAGDLAVSNNQGTWVITAYAVASAIALPITGWLSTRIGCERLMILSTLLFVLLSWACGAAPNFQMLVASRFLQGLAGGPLIPLSQTLLMLNHPPEKRNVALAIFFMVIIVGPVIGPIIGGWITQSYSWRWIFYINVPVGLVCAFIISRILRGRGSEGVKSPVDWIGILLLVGTVGPCQILLDKGEQLDWFRSPVIRLLAAISLISLVFLIIWEKTEKHPLFDLQIFKNRNFFIGILTIFFTYLALFGGIVVTPLWLQTYMDYTSLWAGMALAPLGIFAVILGIPVGKLMNKVSLKVLVVFCFACLAIFAFNLSYLATNISFAKLALYVFLFGLGMSCFLNPLMALSLAEIPREKLSMATGILQFFRTFAQGAGASFFVYLWDRRAIFHHARIVETIYVPLDTPRSAQVLDTAVTKQAYVMATNDIFWVTAWLCFILTFLVLFFKPRKVIDPTPSEN